MVAMYGRRFPVAVLFFICPHPFLDAVGTQTGVDCQQMLASEAMINGISGTRYGMTADYMRIQMMGRSVEIQQMLDRLGVFLASSTSIDWSRYKYSDPSKADPSYSQIQRWQGC